LHWSNSAHSRARAGSELHTEEGESWRSSRPLDLRTELEIAGGHSRIQISFSALDETLIDSEAQCCLQRDRTCVLARVAMGAESRNLWQCPDANVACSQRASATCPTRRRGFSPMGAPRYFRHVLAG